MSNHNRAIYSIKEAMFKHNLNQTQMADRLGVNDSTLSTILSGKRKMSKDVIRKLNKEFDIPLEVLVFPQG